MFKSWNKFIEKDDNLDDSLKLQYAILFRQYEEIFKYRPDVLLTKSIRYYDNQQWYDCKESTLKNCIEWNYGYINKALHKIQKDHENKKDKTKVYSPYLNDWNKYLTELSIDKEVGSYTEVIVDNKNILELFFNNGQPMLDVEYHINQEKTSKQLSQLKYQLVFDEVGTGKTVSALYCVRDVLLEKGLNSKILIICPNNKKTDWKNDIQRQLGRYVHVVENSDNSYIYQNTKELYFKNNEPYILIEGQKVDELKTSCNSWTDEIKWDIVIIDEGHLCFSNYSELKADKAILLTATPIVVNSRTKDDVLEISKLRKLEEYVSLLKKITDTEQNVKLDDLFTSNSVFTQLFREDIDLSAKKRNIDFLECERWKDRELYLDILGDVKGGMTRLVYEQDDDYLLYGVFDRFKDDINADGYLILDKKPNIINTKFEKLKEFLNTNSNKSYIVFFNYKYPADNIYQKLISNQNSLENIENTIIVKKYGGDKFNIFPKDSSVTKENIFEFITNSIENEKRVIFLTTGASGGTGLNLGTFDGVINYELPFTCIELEQRFGRVDRMNLNAESKDMIFILNDDINPMLRYSVLKINATCNFMPIRNTVLFNPDFVEKNIEYLKKEITSCEITQEEQKYFNESFKKREEVIVKNKEIIDRIENHLIKKRALGEFADVTEETEDYANFLHEKRKDILAYRSKVKKLNALSQEVNNWVNLLNSGEIMDNIVTSKQYIDEALVVHDEYKMSEDVQIGNGVIIKDDTIVIETKLFPEISGNLTADTLLKKINIEYDKQEGTSGIFYIKDNKYIRQTVDEFRKGME